jgi:hypothetical protein
MSDKRMRHLVEMIDDLGLSATPKFVAHVIAALETNPPAGIELSVDWDVFLPSLTDIWRKVAD